MSLPHARLAAARAAIAAACLDALPDATLGQVSLRDDQRHIVARAQRAIRQHGGCLTAEEVGRGKTYVALALARQWQAPLIIVPASLRTTWNGAAQRTGVCGAIVSHESLSRGRLPSMPFDGIVVDESHHFRTSTTRRYTALAGLAMRAPIVLLSATPLQNRARDLAAQLALYLGEMAFALDASALSRFVIRGDDAPDAIMPIVGAAEWIELEADDGRVLRAIMDLAPPARPLDAGDAGVLRTISLVRAWASSRAALEATLRSRRRLATAVEQGIEAGRVPTRREARAWHGADDVVQLGFASLLMDHAPSGDRLSELRAALERERATVTGLASMLRSMPDPDPARIGALRRVRRIHPAARIIAFSEFASTISAFFAALRGDAAVGMLTAREARIASGRVTRAELLARFAPIAQHARPVAPQEALTLLLATDLLSEGVNLQDASVVVHLDLPWNPARLAQRIGRVRRPGGAREVSSYILAPPATVDALLNSEARLRRKLEAAEKVVGVGIHVLPRLSRTPFVITGVSPDEPRTSAAAEGVLLARLGRWMRGTLANDSSFLIAAAESDTLAWLAALDDGRLICSLDGIVSESMAPTIRVAELSEGPGRDAGADETQAALGALRAWLDAEQLTTVCGLDAHRSPLRQRVLRWLDRLPIVVPRHLRAEALPMIARMRDRLRFPIPLGAELELARHAERATSRDSNLLEQLSSATQLLDVACRFRTLSLPVRSDVRAIALIVIGPTTGPEARE